jgi:hypothetical protein
MSGKDREDRKDRKDCKDGKDGKDGKDVQSFIPQYILSWPNSCASTLSFSTPSSECPPLVNIIFLIIKQSMQ